ncbi:MAG TPA: hypothetical protein VG167_13530 [Verrucomicrobiae bacterium]|nr:hypothetical protein [Verrucomicrobiae bacterium]
MKVCALGLCWLLSVLAVAAQVTVEVNQDQDQFLQGEALPVAVRITNRSGQPLDLGAGNDWLTFNLQDRDGRVVAKLGEVPVAGEFTLDSSMAATKHVDLQPYFVLNDPGRYGIIATLKIKAWDKEIDSPIRYFDIIEGAKLWEQEVGVPRPPGSPPEVRKYTLQQANYIRGQLRMYLRVSDAYGRAIRVCAIGPMVSFGQPETQVDRLSQLHVLYQNGPSTFSYTVFNLNGDNLIRQTYLYIDTRPRLRMDDDANVLVQGGTRKVTPNDFPPPSASEILAPAVVTQPDNPGSNVAKAKKSKS